MVNLSFVCVRAIILEVADSETLPYYIMKSLDRISKVSTLVLAMSINFEKEILNVFMIFQQSYKLDEFAVAKDDYRRLESMNFSLYKLELLLITVLTLVVTIVTCIPWSNFYRNWINCIIDMFILCITGAVVRSAIS